MANPFIAVRITPELDAAIAARMQETGQSKSDVVIESLKSYLGIMPFTQRLTCDRILQIALLHHRRLPIDQSTCSINLYISELTCHRSPQDLLYQTED
jgi:hypothetical protein